jgi:DTW domain-containing protein YfiP
MRGSVAPNLEDRCAACLLLHRWCYCAHIPRLQPRTRIVIIRHWKERCRTSNTGRLVQQAIPGTRLIDYGAPGAPFDPASLDLSQAALLFPGEHPSPTKPEVLVVVDGSWPQARKMVQRIPGLRTLPRIGLQPLSLPPARIRRPPMQGGMATVEAVARALDHLEGPGAGEPLDDIFSHFVDTLQRMRGATHRPR